MYVFNIHTQVFYQTQIHFIFSAKCICSCLLW